MLYLINISFILHLLNRERKKKGRKERREEWREGKKSKGKKSSRNLLYFYMPHSLSTSLYLKKKKKKERKEMEENKEKCERTSLFHHLLLSISPFYPLNEEA
jgi:hypothetical protein